MMNYVRLLKLRSVEYQLKIVRNVRGSRATVLEIPPKPTSTESELAVVIDGQEQFDASDIKVIRDYQGKYWAPPTKPPRFKNMVWYERKQMYILESRLHEMPDYYTDRSFENAEIARDLYGFGRKSKATIFHRIVDEEKRARRQMPVPMSLTGIGLDDGQKPKVWRSRIMNVIRELENENDEIKSESMLDNVTPSVKLLFEQMPEKLSDDHRQLLDVYAEEKNKKPAATDTTEVEKSDVHFPFALSSSVRERLMESKLTRS